MASGQLTKCYTAKCGGEECAAEILVGEYPDDRQAKDSLIDASWGYFKTKGWICPNCSAVAESWGVDVRNYPIRDRDRKEVEDVES